MTRKNQTQYAFIRQLLILYALFALISCINLRSVIKSTKEYSIYELVFAVWNTFACCILFSFSMKRPRNPDLKYARNRVISHDTIASLWSLITFSWMTPMIKLGNLRNLTEDDLWELPSRCQAAQCYYELDR